jgi:hypothetical protein
MTMRTHPRPWVKGEKRRRAYRAGFVPVGLGTVGRVLGEEGEDLEVEGHQGQHHDERGQQQTLTTEHTHTPEKKNENEREDNACKSLRENSIHTDGKANPREEEEEGEEEEVELPEGEWRAP